MLKNVNGSMLRAFVIAAAHNTIKNSTCTDLELLVLEIGVNIVKKRGVSI